MAPLRAVVLLSVCSIVSRRISYQLPAACFTMDVTRAQGLISHGSEQNDGRLEMPQFTRCRESAARQSARRSCLIRWGAAPYDSRERPGGELAKEHPELRRGGTVKAITTSCSPACEIPFPAPLTAVTYLKYLSAFASGQYQLS